MRKRPLAARITGLETSSVHWGYFLGTFLGLVIARNLLEGVFGPDRSLGFVHFASPSALMVLDHFVLFYTSLFLSFSILLALLAREKISRVMKVAVPAWIIVLLPPIVDFIVSAGRGIALRYVLDPSPVILRFFDPRSPVEGVSPGQRIEILLACLLALSYAGIKTRSVWRSLAAFAGIYLLVAAHAVLPAAYARFADLLAQGHLRSASAAYAAAFKSGGMVQEESRKLALLFLFTSIPLGWGALAMHAPRKTSAFCGNVRPLLSLHYLAMTGFGLALAWAVFKPAGVQIAWAGDILGAVAVCAATFFALQASIGLNDIFDEEADRIAGARRPLVAGSLERRDVLLGAAAFGLVALLAAVNVKYSTFLLVALALAVSLAYSAPPLRLKRFLLLGTLTLGLLSLVACLIGFSALAEERSAAIFPPRLAWLLVLAFGITFTAKDLKDIEGDRATGTLTIPVLLGEWAGRIVIAMLLFVGYLLVPILLPYPMLGLSSVVMGVVSALLVYFWRHRGIDKILLALYLIYAVLVAGVVLYGVDAILDGRAPIVEAEAARIRGATAATRTDWAEAVRWDLRALSVFESDADLLERAGVSLFKGGRMGEAAAVLARSVSADPSSPVTWEYLAMAEAATGREDLARERMTDAVARGLRPGVFLEHLGEMDLEAGSPEMARDELSAALRLGQPDLPARLRYADAVLATGSPADARRQYEAVVARNPSSGEAHDALGRFYHLSGENDRALAEFRTAVGLNPGEPTYWNNLGVACRDAARYDEALDALNYATRLDPRMIDPYYNRGRLFEAIGRPAAARREYLLALEIDPDFAPARQALESERAGEEESARARERD